MSTAATAEPVAELDDGETTINIADMDPALKAAIRRWHDQAYKIHLMLQAPTIILSDVVQEGDVDVEGTIPPVLEIVEQCITMLSSLSDEIDNATCGRVLIDTESAGG